MHGCRQRGNTVPQRTGAGTTVFPQGHTRSFESLSKHGAQLPGWHLRLQKCFPHDSLRLHCLRHMCCASTSDSSNLSRVRNTFFSRLCARLLPSQHLSMQRWRRHDIKASFTFRITSSFFLELAGYNELSCMTGALDLVGA